MIGKIFLEKSPRSLDQEVASLNKQRHAPHVVCFLKPPDLERRRAENYPMLYFSCRVVKIIFKTVLGISDSLVKRYNVPRCFPTDVGGSASNGHHRDAI